MWQVIAKGSSLEEFEASTTTQITDLPKGTPLLYRVELPAWAPIGGLADLVGAEFLAQYFVPNGIDVDDVYGGWRWVEIKATVDPPLGPWTAVAVIVLALSALGIASLITYIILKGDLPGFLKGELLGLPLWAWGIGGAAALYLIVDLASRGKRAPPTQPIIIYGGEKWPARRGT